jgi:hypothetical protein
MGVGGKAKKATIKFNQKRLKDVITDRRRGKQKKAFNEKDKDSRRQRQLGR